VGDIQHIDGHHECLPWNEFLQFQHRGNVEMKSGPGDLPRGGAIVCLAVTGVTRQAHAAVNEADLLPVRLLSGGGVPVGDLVPAQRSMSIYNHGPATAPGYRVVVRTEGTATIRLGLDGFNKLTETCTDSACSIASDEDVSTSAAGRIYLQVLAAPAPTTRSKSWCRSRSPTRTRATTSPGPPSATRLTCRSASSATTARRSRPATAASSPAR
jgi:hypothetical protein